MEVFNIRVPESENRANGWLKLTRKKSTLRHMTKFKDRKNEERF